MTSVDSLDAGPDVIGWDDLDKRKLYVIGPTFSLFVRAILYPPMLIKTRLQVQNSPYKGTLDAFRKVIKYEGFRALYKGFPTNCVGLAVGQVYITAYEVSRKHAVDFGLGHGWSNFAAGAAASTVSQCFIVPIDVVTQLQMVQGQGTAQTANSNTAATRTTGSTTASQTSTSSPGTLEQRRKLHTEPTRDPAKLPGTPPSSSSGKPAPVEVPAGANKLPAPTRNAHDIAKFLYRTEGIRGLYRGYFASLFTYVPSSAIWWASYGVCSSYTHRAEFSSSVPSPVVNAMCGGTAGLVASVTTNPLDVIRTRLQVEGTRSAWKTVDTMWKEDGHRWLARGVTARIMSAVPSGAVIITSYEYVKWLSRRTS